MQADIVDEWSATLPQSKHVRMPVIRHNLSSTAMRLRRSQTTRVVLGRYVTEPAIPR
jgi:hypothetical protein